MVADWMKNADRLAGLTALVLIGLGFAQIILGELLLKSVALVANGIDCIGDGFVSGIVWIGLAFFRKPADDRFHYGYYKMESLASAVAAIVMLLLAAYIVFRSYGQLVNPHEVNSPIMGAIVAAIAAVIAISLGIYKYRGSQKSNMGSVKLEAFNTIKDGVASGLTVVALIFAHYGYLRADAIAGFAIAGLIVTIGFVAIKESSHMLVDACDQGCIDRSFVIKAIAEEIPDVDSAHLVRLRKTGPFYQGELEIIVSHDMTIGEFKLIKNKILSRVRSRLPDVKNLTISIYTG